MQQHVNQSGIKRVITRCGCDWIIPLCFVYIFYIILHGHLSPGGGFQGGILTVALVLRIQDRFGDHRRQRVKESLDPLWIPCILFDNVAAFYLCVHHAAPSFFGAGALSCLARL